MHDRCQKDVYIFFNEFRMLVNHGLSIYSLCKAQSTSLFSLYMCVYC